MFELLLDYIRFLFLTTQQLVYGVILGVVQGISEWLPISSKTQIIIVSTYLLHITSNEAYTFGLFMEIGTIFAAIIYFRKELLTLIKYIFGERTPESRALFNYVLVSTIFTGIVGAPLYLIADSIAGKYNAGLPIVILGLVLIGDAILIWYSRSKYKKNKIKRKVLKDLNFRDYILVGIAQGIAALQGVSRSGATTSTLLLLDVDASEAFRLSFIDMIFATAGAIALTYIASKAYLIPTIKIIGLSGLLVSIVVATVISLFLIDFLLNIAKKAKIIYLVSALGAITLVIGLLVIIH